MQNGLTSNIKLEISTVDQKNYYTPLTSQVEALETTNRLCSLEVVPTHTPELALERDKSRPTGARRGNLMVQLPIPQHHTDKDSAEWRRHPCTKKGSRHQNTLLTDQQVKIGVIGGKIPSAAWDKICTSHAGMVGDPFI